MTRKVKHLANDDNLKSLARGETPLQNVAVNRRIELGEVLEFSSSHNSYRVVTRGTPGDPLNPGGRLLQGVPRKVDNPGSSAPLAIGTSVIIEWGLGFPYIDGVLNINTSKTKVESGTKPSPNIGGDKSVAAPTDNTQQEHTAYYRQPGTPEDVMAGDQVFSTPDGNRMGSLRGHYNVMDAGASNKAKFEQFGDRDLTRLTTEDYELITGFGVMNVFNTEGRCGLTFRAAADQLTESGGSDEQWTFKVDIGDTGDYFTMEVCTPDGATQAKVQMTANGRITLLGTDGIDLVDGGKTASHQEYAADLIVRVLGDIKKIVSGTATETYESTRTTTVSEADQKTVGHNESTSINNHHIMNIGGNQQIQINGGTPLEASPTNIAVDMQVLNGSYFLELGNPLAGASPLGEAGFTVAVNNGDIVLGQNPSLLATPSQNATVSLNTLLQNSVGLGGTVGPSSNMAIMHATKYEPLMGILTAIMAIHDTHVHVPPIGGPPALLMSPTLSSLISQIMSTRVLIGG